MKRSLLFISLFSILLSAATFGPGCAPADDPSGSAGAGGEAAGTSGAAGNAAGSANDAGSGGAGGDQGGEGGAGGTESGGTSSGPVVALCGDTSSCTRPSTTPLSAPYLGAPGQEGCPINARCNVGVGANNGKCIPQGCYPESGDPAVPANINATANCNAPHDFVFEGKASEIYRFGGTMSVPSTAAAGANVGVKLLLDGTPVIESLNEVGFGGAPYPNEPATGERWYSLRKSGFYTLRFSVEQCVPITIAANIERKAEAAFNLTKENAFGVAAGSVVDGTLSCEEDRWFVLSPQAGQAIQFTLSGKAFAPETGGGALATLLDASLTPLIENGNGVDIGSNFSDQAPTPASRTVTFANGGLHYLKLTFWNGCAPSTFSLSLAAM